MSSNGSGFSSNTVSSLVASNVLTTGWDSQTATATIIANLNSNLAPITGSSASFSNFISSNLTAQKPTTFDAFVSDFATFFNLSSANQSQVATIITNAITDQLGMSGNPDANKMNAVANLTNQSTSQGGLGVNLINDIVKTGFSNFLQQFDYSGAVNDTSFVNAFKTFFVHFATVTTLSPDTSLNFEDVYNAFFSPNPTAFEQFLAKYIKDSMYNTSDGGNSFQPTGTTFLPSNQIGDWLQKVQDSYSTAIYGTPQGTSSVAGNFSKVDIINKVLALIIEMVGTLQQVAAAQSDRLNILTSWQTAYTNLQTQIPTFIAGDNTRIGNGTSDISNSARSSANAFNQTLTANVQARSNVVQDDAKALQSNLNQSTDTANQQANMGTAIIQELSGILNSIYR